MDCSAKEVFDALFSISDYLCVGVIMFAGASWMLGNKTKAIEHIIGGSAGYLIVRHAITIQEWLKSIAVSN